MPLAALPKEGGEGLFNNFMKTTDIMTLTAALALAASSCSAPEKTEESPAIGRQEIAATDGRMTPEALWAMGRIGAYAVSPDG